MEYNSLAPVCVLQAVVFCFYLHTRNLVASAPFVVYTIARPENNAKKAVLQSANCKEQI